MNILEYVISAKRCLSANKMRTLLTTLGIIVGISSVILIKTIGSSLGQTIENVVYSMYSGNEAYLCIVPEKNNTDVEYDENGNYDIPENIGFTLDMMDEYDKQFSEQAQRVVSDWVFGQGKINISDKFYSTVEAAGASYTLKDYFNIKMLDGRFITKQDTDRYTPVAVISDITAESCFGDKNPLGEKIIISNGYGSFLECTIIGIYKYANQGSALMAEDIREVSTPLYVPYTYMFREMDYTPEDFYISYSIKNVTDTDKYKAETESFFNSYFEGTGWKVYVELMTDQLDMVTKVIDGITFIIAAVAAISLLVGGIGVMNIMLVSVTERTMEIGVRKAMGASNKSVRIQFIIESVMISFLGSLLGIITGLVQSKLLAMIAVRIADSKNFNLIVDITVPYGAILLSVLFSFIVGIGFGVYPAEKAAKMEVVDALRYE